MSGGFAWGMLTGLVLSWVLGKVFDLAEREERDHDCEGTSDGRDGGDLE